MLNHLAHLFRPKASASLILLGLLVSALSQTTGAAAQKGPNVSANDCAGVVVATTWPANFTARAESVGPCGRATLILSVSNLSGQIVWDDTGPSDQYFGFDDVTDVDLMYEALNLWIGDYASVSTTGTLPDWVAGEEYPLSSEFPFYVDEGVTRDDYLQVRAADHPMICYVQGRESMRCLHPAANGYVLETVGVQSFPG